MKIFDLLFCSASEGAAAVQVPSGAPLTRKQLKGKVQARVQGLINDFWKEKVGHDIMQGDYLALLSRKND